MVISAVMLLGDCVELEAVSREFGTCGKPGLCILFGKMHSRALSLVWGSLWARPNVCLLNF